MNQRINFRTKCVLIIVSLLMATNLLSAQRHECDSMLQVINGKLTDQERVKTLRFLSYSMYKFAPDSALSYAYEAMHLAKKIKYQDGISNSYEIIAIILTRMGNYNKALSFYIQNLKIEESLSSPDGIASARNNIGIVYTYMKDFPNALKYYKSADSLITNNKIEDLYYTIKLNLGDLYEKMNNADSAFISYNESLNIAINSNENYQIGKSLLGLGNVYAKMNKDELAIASYRSAIGNLMAENDEDLISEASLGLAKVFKKESHEDSSLLYARKALSLSIKDNFVSRNLDASTFLVNYFSNKKMLDSAYFYLKNSVQLKDSILGIEKMRRSEQITFEENARQIELKEKALLEKEERRQQLQHIFIGIFIPLLFLLTIILTKSRVKIGVIRFLGVISLLFLFEYLTLLLHPVVLEITHHTPILEILIFVVIAGILIPAHHKIEHWLIELLVKRVQNPNSKLDNLSEKVKTKLTQTSTKKRRHR